MLQRTTQYTYMYVHYKRVFVKTEAELKNWFEIWNLPKHVFPYFFLIGSG